jgi:hypothetical protein
MSGNLQHRLGDDPIAAPRPVAPTLFGVQASFPPTGNRRAFRSSHHQIADGR